MKNKTKKRSFFSGFTLIELLVVIAIIGVLAALGTVNYTAAQQKSRDSRRRSDYTQIKTALIMYQQDHNTFPPNSVISWDASWFDAIEPYFPAGVVPKDPKNVWPNYFHYITYDAGATYQLHWSIENTGEPENKFPPECTPFVPAPGAFSLRNWNGVDRLVCLSP